MTANASHASLQMTRKQYLKILNADLSAILIFILNNLRDLSKNENIYVDF